MTLFGRSLEEDGLGPKRMPRSKPNSTGAPMNAIKPAVPAHGRIAEQVPTFAAIGLFGYFVDAGDHLPRRQISRPVAGARPAAGLHPRDDRQFRPQPVDHLPPCALTAAGAFLRYCGVASVGLAVNYAVYSACVFLAPSAGIAVTPAILPLFVAAGSGVAMVLTFVGFRFFAFRP